VRGSSSICEIAGTAILGDGGGGGIGGLNSDPPGGMSCADAAFPTASAAMIAQAKIDICFMKGMS
jgi:hypothetical protein